MNQFPLMSINSVFNLPNHQPPRQNIQIQRVDSQSQIKQDLYNSISEGMSYDEVRSIIGWDGVLIYQNDIENGDRQQLGATYGPISEKFYQWNNENSRRVGETNPYWSVTLQFQNDVLVGKTSSGLKR